MSFSEWIKDLPSEMGKNLEVVRDQWDDYSTEVRHVIIPGIRRAPWYRKPHKASAFIEEWFDKCPRINAYVMPPILVALAIL